MAKKSVDLYAIHSLCNMIEDMIAATANFKLVG